MTNNTDIIASFLKGLRVLECFNADTPRLSIAEVSDQTGLDRAAARRCLLTLHEAGYTEYDGKFFTPTPRILRLGMSALAALPLPQLVQPWLDQISEQIGQSCSVSILDDADIVYIARAAQRRVMSIGLLPGSRLPAHCTSMGRVLLAAMPTERAREVVEKSDLFPRTSFSLTEPDEIMAEINHVRYTGFALVDQEVEMGLRSLAVPLYNVKGVVVAAMNAGIAAAQMPSEAIVQECLPAFLKAQEGLRRILI